MTWHTGAVQPGFIDKLQQSLLEGGPVVFTMDDLGLATPAVATFTPEESFLRQLDRVARLDAPGSPPELHVDSAAWGMQRFACLVVALLARQRSPAETAADLAEGDRPAARAEEPSTAWSVDLSLRHLGGLAVQARSLVPDDPLRREIRRLALEWPLSGACLPLADRPDPPNDLALPEHPALRLLHRDRVDVATRPERASHAR